MRLFIKIYIIIFLLLLNISYTNDISIEETKMRNLATELRCMVCQNQSLLDSDSELAKDLKKLILKMYIDGKSTDEIKTYLVERYGEFILFKPEINNKNFILWAAPIFSFLLVSIIAMRNMNFKNKKK